MSEPISHSPAFAPRFSLEKIIFLVAAVLLLGFQVKFWLVDQYEGKGEGEGDRIAFKEGETVPDLKVRLLDGITATTLGSMVGEKPTLLLFMERGCGPCEMQIKNLARSNSDKDLFQVVLVSSDDEEWVRGEVARLDAKFPVILEPEGELRKAFGVFGFPTSALLDRDRRVVFSKVGFESQLSLHANYLLTPHLSNPGQVPP